MTTQAPTCSTVEFGDPEGRALAARLFPEAWAYAETLTGKQRSSRMATLRRQAKTSVAMDALRAAGRSCATCQNFKNGPERMGKVCDAHSDFHGYQLATADGLCTDWSAK